MNTRQVPPCWTIGIDLASQPRRTAACAIEWTEQGGALIDLGVGTLDDERLVELISEQRAVRVGIDAPFGFPVSFADALTAYRSTGIWPELPPGELRFRATEIALGHELGITPLSPVTDRLVWPAMRCASLLSRTSPGGVRRIGGRAVEVYPGAALKRWLGDLMGSGAGSYKGDGPGPAQRRKDIVAGLISKAGPALELSSGLRGQCEATDHQLDALVSALVARACDRGCVDAIPVGSGWLAMSEGWITMPTADALVRLI